LIGGRPGCGICPRAARPVTLVWVKRVALPRPLCAADLE